MKPIRLLLGVAALLACCYASAQSLQLRKDKISVKEAMDLITQTTGYSFIYASSDIDMTAVVKLHADNQRQEHPSEKRRLHPGRSKISDRRPGRRCDR